MDKSLIYIFDSKQFAYNNININHRTLNDCLYNGKLYLNRFLFSIVSISEFNYKALIELEKLKKLIWKVRSEYKNIQIKSKRIYGENINNLKLNKQFNSINEFAKFI